MPADRETHPAYDLAGPGRGMVTDARTLVAMPRPGHAPECNSQLATPGGVREPCNCSAALGCAGAPAPAAVAAAPQEPDVTVEAYDGPQSWRWMSREWAQRPDCESDLVAMVREKADAHGVVVLPCGEWDRLIARVAPAPQAAAPVAPALAADREAGDLRAALETYVSHVRMMERERPRGGSDAVWTTWERQETTLRAAVLRAAEAHTAEQVAKVPKWEGPCGLSWDGFNLSGDKASIAEANRMRHVAAQEPQWRAMLAAERDESERHKQGSKYWNTRAAEEWERARKAEAALAAERARGDEMRKDAARWRYIADNWPDVTLGWQDVETGNFGGEHGDIAQYVRTPSVAVESRDESYEGDSPAEAVDAAMLAARPPAPPTPVVDRGE
jgi:hypothetical protein